MFFGEVLEVCPIDKICFLLSIVREKKSPIRTDQKQKNWWEMVYLPAPYQVNVLHGFQRIEQK